MTHFVKEIFYTLQGVKVVMPGALRSFADSPAATCGRASRRIGIGRSVNSATPISWAPTGTTVAGSKNANELADAVARVWDAATDEERFVVCTGAEPLLQLDMAAIGALHDRGFEISAETNGTQVPPPGLDWLCVSPKLGSELAGKCMNLHGHSWWMEAKVSAPALHAGAVVEFGALKARVREWIDTNRDHGAMLGAADPLACACSSHRSR